MTFYCFKSKYPEFKYEHEIKIRAYSLYGAKEFLSKLIDLPTNKIDEAYDSYTIEHNEPKKSLK